MISELPMRSLLDHYAPKGKMRTISIVSDNKPEICFSIEFFKMFYIQFSCSPLLAGWGA